MAVIAGKPTDGPVSRYINRRFSTRITAFIVRKGIPVTPNQVSLLSFALALASAPLYLARLDPLAGVVVQLASIVDGVDGELARARGCASPLGGFVDAVLDRLADAAVVAGICLAYLPSQGPTAVAIGLLAMLGSLLVSYVHARGEASLGVHPSKLGSVPMFASRDVRLFALFLGSLFYQALAALAVVAAASLAYALLKTADVYLAYKRLNPPKQG